MATRVEAPRKNRTEKTATLLEPSPSLSSFLFHAVLTEIPTNDSLHLDQLRRYTEFAATFIQNLPATARNTAQELAVELGKFRLRHVLQGSADHSRVIELSDALVDAGARLRDAKALIEHARDTITTEIIRR